MKYFHLYADQKTVREISQQEYARLSQRLGYTVCWVDNSGVLFVKGHYVIHVPKAQLAQVLNGDKKEEVS